jgi:O-antigen/teichoic acid export membrane protein
MAAALQPLFRRVSVSVFWNVLLLPVVTICTLATSVIVRRRFGLNSGSYDVLLGLVSTVLFYSGFGIAPSLMKTLPEREVAGARPAVVRLLQRAAFARFVTLFAFVIILNIFARRLAQHLHLGVEGSSYIHALGALIGVRAAIELIVYTLYAFLAQFQVNLLILLQALLDPSFIAIALALRYGIQGVVFALAASGAVVVVVGLALVGSVVRALPEHPPRRAASTLSPAWKFSLFDYVVEMSRYFGGPDFSRTALGAVVTDQGLVAIFAVGFYLAFMVVNLIASIFRGIYRPMFTRLRVERNFSELQRTFDAISKVQIVLLVPSGVGLAIMVADYVPLLYTSTFAPAIAVTRILIALLFTETAFNQAIIILSVDERYGTVLAAMVFQIVAAPLQLAAASSFGIEAAALALGLGRTATAGVAYLSCRRRYTLRFPWSFTAKVFMASIAMAAALIAGRLFWPTSVAEAVTLTTFGVIVFGLSLRFGRVLGDDDFELLRRANVPGGQYFIRFLGASARHP